MSNSYYSSFMKNNSISYPSNMLENIIENIPVGIMVLNSNFDIILWNSVQESITSIHRKDIIGKNFFNEFSYLFNPIASRLKIIFSSKETIVLNRFPFYTDNTNLLIKYFNIKINVINNVDGFNGVMFSTEDCTKLENVEDKLYENKETVKAIFDSTAEGILVLDSTGKVVNYNKYIKNIMEIYDNPIDKNDILEFVINKVKNSEDIKYKIKQVFNTKRKFFTLIELKDGRIFESLSSPLIKNNTLIGRLYSFRDVTKQKLDEKLLRESENYYRKLIEFLPASILLHIDNKIVFANNATAKMLGLDSPTELIGKEIFDFISKDFHELTREKTNIVQAYKQFTPLIEEEFIKKDGSIINVQVVSGLFPYKGNIASLVVAQDISQNKKAAELQEKFKENTRLLREAREFDKIKTEFFANISHELRTPLNVILSALQILNPDSNISLTKEKSVTYLNTMKQNCFRLLRLVNNLIDITKIDSGYFEIHLSNHNIVSIVEDITLSVAKYTEHKSITLIFDTDIEEKLIACDPDKIERIILNLISNSVKFTEPGGEILVTVHDAVDNIVISVRDTGIGIPENKLSIIFERFRQVDKSLTRNHEGSGIGLSLVKSLVELHDGEIFVKSTYGQGTEFIVKLPAILTEDDDMSSKNVYTPKNYVERINIEFSDIYS